MGTGAYPDGPCDSTTITTWARKMSALVKSIDHNHLLSAGYEGFFCRDQVDRALTQQYGASGFGAGFGESCTGGLNTVALASLPDIDLMSMHLYPDTWQTTTDRGTGWIAEHALAAEAIGTPNRRLHRALPERGVCGGGGGGLTPAACSRPRSRLSRPVDCYSADPVESMISISERSPSSSHR